MNRMTIFPTNANSPLRRILRRGVYIGTAASIGAFAMLCHAQSEVAQNLSESDIRTLAVFFSKQHPPLAPTSVPPTALVTAGKQLAETGVGTSVQACFSCHGAGGKGNGARFPSIAGEPAAFTIARLHEFQAREDLDAQTGKHDRGCRLTQ